jgi:hypothetical protein
MSAPSARARLESALTRHLRRSRYTRLESGGVIVGETTGGRWPVIWLADDAGQSLLVIDERAVRLSRDGTEAILEVREQPWAPAKR